MSVQDNYSNAPAHMQDPVKFGFTPSASDTVDLTYVTRSIYIGGAGAIRVTLKDMQTDTYVTYSAIPAGTSLPLRIQRLWSTGTTATNLVAEL